MPKLTVMPGKDRDAESGQYVRSYSDEAFLRAVRELGPAVGTKGVADRVGCDRDTAYGRLLELEEAGRIANRKVGQSLLWSITEHTEQDANTENQ